MTERNLMEITENQSFTYKEISTCPQKNWKFWSESAKISLKFYREHKSNFGSNFGLTKSHKVDFRLKLQKRKEQVHLNKE
jgi:hypothetical protein